jgi:hypothetical protein
MKTTARTLRFTGYLMAMFALVPWANARADAPATDPSPDMIRELQAADPNRALGDGAEALGNLVGSWDIEYGFISKDGTVKHESGEYFAGWVMDGRAMQDLWIVHQSPTRKQKEVYTTLRYVDPKSGTLHATFIDPQIASIANFTGTVDGNDRIAALTHDFSDKGDQQNRWSFNDIGPNSFVFRDEQSNDGGKTWRVVEEDHMTRRGAKPAGPNYDMVRALQAAGPNPSLGNGAGVFDRFVGTWDGVYNEFSKDGKTTRSLGEWTFGWVMDGRVIQDLFIIHPSKTRTERYMGATLRYFNPKSKTWGVTFIDPENNAVETLTGGAVGDDRIVLLSQDTDGKQRRWSLVDIRPDSWIFRDEASGDGGKTWRLLEEDHMTRRGANGGANQATM